MATFALEVARARDNEPELTLWQLPNNSRREKRVRTPERPDAVARLWGSSLALARETILDLLRDAGHRGVRLPGARSARFELSEDAGVRLGILMEAIKPLRRPDRVLSVMDGVAQMSHEEACYWFSKATGRASHAERRRAMKALRILLAREGY